MPLRFGTSGQRAKRALCADLPRATRSLHSGSLAIEAAGWTEPRMYLVAQCSPLRGRGNRESLGFR